MKAFVKSLRWKGPVFGISAIDGDGCRALTFAVQDWLDAHPAQAHVPEAEEAPVVVTPPPVDVRRRRTRAGTP